MEPYFSGMGLEVAGRCNAKCMFCTWGNDPEIKHKNVFTGEIITRSNDKISLDLVDRIIDEHQLKLIIFTGVCEPLLAPDRIFYIAEKSLNNDFKFALYTNGTLLTEEISRKLLSYPTYSSLNISLNAASDSMRRNVMGLPLDKAEENFIKFLDIRKEMDREKDVPVGCVMMLTPINRGEENIFRRKWKEIFSRYKNCQEPGVFNSNNWDGSVKNYWMNTKNPQSCGQWNTNSPTISVDGYIYLCCYSSRFVFGHVLDPDAVSRWFRRKEIFKVVNDAGGQYPMELCGECSMRFESSWKRKER